MKKINIIDIAIILVLIFVMFVGYVYLSGKNIIKNVDKITYNMTIEDISLEAAAEIDVDENIYNSVNGKNIGKIIDVKVKEYQEDFFDKTTGEYKKVTKIEHYSVDVIVEADAENRDGLYYVGDLKIGVGTKAYLRGSNYVCQGKILGIKEVFNDEK